MNEKVRLLLWDSFKGHDWLKDVAVTSPKPGDIAVTMTLTRTFVEELSNEQRTDLLTNIRRTLSSTTMNMSGTDHAYLTMVMEDGTLVGEATPQQTELRFRTA